MKLYIYGLVELYGSQRQYLGPVHGFASNLTPLLLGKSLLTDEDFQQISAKAMMTLVRTALQSKFYIRSNVFGRN